MMAGRFSGEAYGRLMGLQQTMMALAMAGGPFLVGAAVVVLLAVPLVFAAGARIPAPGGTYGKENQA